MTAPEPGDERMLVNDAIARIKAAPPLPRSGDRAQRRQVSAARGRHTGQLHAGPDPRSQQTAGRPALGTTNIFSTGSGHNMMLYQPKFVADNIIDIVERVREG